MLNIIIVAIVIAGTIYLVNYAAELEGKRKAELFIKYGIKDET